MRNLLPIVSSALIAAGVYNTQGPLAQVPSWATLRSPAFRVHRGPLAQVPGPLAQVPGPLAQETPELPIENEIPFRPERVGLVRTPTNTSRWVNLTRPVGASDTCTKTTLLAATGEQWVSSEGPNYVKNNDGTWSQYRVPDTVAQGPGTIVLGPGTVAQGQGTCNRVIYYASTPDLGGGGGGSTGNLNNGFYRARWGTRRGIFRRN